MQNFAKCHGRDEVELLSPVNNAYHPDCVFDSYNVPYFNMKIFEQDTRAIGELPRMAGRSRNGGDKSRG